MNPVKLTATSPCLHGCCPGLEGHTASRQQTPPVAPLVQTWFSGRSSTTSTATHILLSLLPPLSCSQKHEASMHKETCCSRLVRRQKHLFPEEFLNHSLLWGLQGFIAEFLKRKLDSLLYVCVRTAADSTAVDSSHLASSSQIYTQQNPTFWIRTVPVLIRIHLHSDTDARRHVVQQNIPAMTWFKM